MSTKSKIKGVVVNNAEALSKEAEKELTPEALESKATNQESKEDKR